MLSSKATIDDMSKAQFKCNRVFVRVDFNVPLTKAGEVADKTRIAATIPTIKRLKELGASRIILASHLGRPDGQVNMKYTLKPVVPVLSELLGEPVEFLSDCVGPEVEKVCCAPVDCTKCQIILLENVRFHAEEEGVAIINEEKVKSTKEEIEKFRHALSKLADVYVCDAFGAAHRAHSSIVGVNKKTRVAGLLLKKELTYFAKVMESPAKPVGAILGGAKVKDKVPLIENLLERIDVLLIGGGMAPIFLKVLENMKIGKSLYDDDSAKVVPQIMEKAKAKKVKVVLPIDFVIANKFEATAETKIVSKETGVEDEWMSLDIGPKSIELFAAEIKASKTIVWNGPCGVFEMEAFAKGSLALVDAVVEATEKGSISIIGGGDTASLVEMAGKSSKVSHVSTGGGASLELLEGKKLPGVVALSERKECCGKCGMDKPCPMKVSVLGATGGIGQALSLLLMTNPKISELSLYDIPQSMFPMVGVAADLSHINTVPKVAGFAGDDEFEKCVQGSKIIVCLSGAVQRPGMTRDDLFEIDAKIINSIANMTAKYAPDAILCVVTNPVNSLVPLAVEIYKKNNVHNAEKKVVGLTCLDVTRARTFYAEREGLNAHEVHVPVIGAHAGETILALFSRATPPPKKPITEEEAQELDERVMNGAAYVIDRKNGSGSATLSMAYATANFVNNLIKGFNGDYVYDYAYVHVKDEEYFSLKLDFGPSGIEGMEEIGKLSAYEEKRLQKCKEVLAPQIRKGLDYLKR